jgi:hypothetical protein
MSDDQLAIDPRRSPSRHWQRKLSSGIDRSIASLQHIAAHLPSVACAIARPTAASSKPIVNQHAC